MQLLADEYQKEENLFYLLTTIANSEYFYEIKTTKMMNFPIFHLKNVLLLPLTKVF